MRTRAPPELDVGVDFWSTGAVVELEMLADGVELERAVLDPTGGVVIPPNWVSAVAERTATTIIRTAKIKRFPNRLAMAYRFSRLPVNPATGGEEAIFHPGDSCSIVAAGEKDLDPG